MSNHNKFSFVFLVVLILMFPGCFSEDGADPGTSIPTASELDLSFQSRPNQNNILGTISSNYEIPAASIDVLLQYNGTSQYCAHAGQECRFDGTREHPGDTFTIVYNQGFPSCYEECRITVTVFYLGNVFSTFDAINF